MVATGVDVLPLVGGHVGLDLVNTVEPRLAVPVRHEHLDSPAALLVWARRAELLTAAESGAVTTAWTSSRTAAEAALGATLDIRESLHRVLLGVVDPTARADDRDAALQRLGGHWAAAAGRSRLVPDDQDRTAVRMQVGTDPTALVPDRLAVAAVDLLRSGDLTHLHACPEREGGCGWMFLDLSRNGSRRWCSMADCGARAKARRLTERRRAERARPRPG